MGNTKSRSTPSPHVTISVGGQVFWDAESTPPPKRCTHATIKEGLQFVCQEIAGSVWEALSKHPDASLVLQNIFKKDPKILSSIKSSVETKCRELTFTAYAQQRGSGVLLSEETQQVLPKCGVDLALVPNPRGKPEVVDHRIKDDLIAMLVARTHQPPAIDACFTYTPTDASGGRNEHLVINIAVIGIIADDLDFANSLLATTGTTGPNDPSGNDMRMYVPVLLHSPFLDSSRGLKDFRASAPGVFTTHLPPALCAKSKPHGKGGPSSEEHKKAEAPSPSPGRGTLSLVSKAVTPPSFPPAKAVNRFPRPLDGTKPTSVPPQDPLLPSEQSAFFTTVRKILKRLPNYTCRVQELPALASGLGFDTLAEFGYNSSKGKVAKALGGCEAFRITTVMELPDNGVYVSLRNPFPGPSPPNPLTLTSDTLSTIEHIVKTEGAVPMMRMRKLFPEACGRPLVTSPFGGMKPFHEAVAAAITNVEVAPGTGWELVLTYSSGLSCEYVADLLTVLPDAQCPVNELDALHRYQRSDRPLLHRCGSILAALRSLAAMNPDKFALQVVGGREMLSLCGATGNAGKALTPTASVCKKLVDLVKATSPNGVAVRKISKMFEEKWGHALLTHPYGGIMATVDKVLSHPEYGHLLSVHPPGPMKMDSRLKFRSGSEEAPASDTSDGADSPLASQVEETALGQLRALATVEESRVPAEGKGEPSAISEVEAQESKAPEDSGVQRKAMVVALSVAPHHALYCDEIPTVYTLLTKEAFPYNEKAFSDASTAILSFVAKSKEFEVFENPLPSATSPPGIRMLCPSEPHRWNWQVSVQLKHQLKPLLRCPDTTICNLRERFRHKFGKSLVVSPFGGTIALLLTMFGPDDQSLQKFLLRRE